jgi:hypothetical protein
LWGGAAWSAPGLPDQLCAIVETRRVQRVRLAAFPLAMHRNDRGELPENERSECHAT